MEHTSSPETSVPYHKITTTGKTPKAFLLLLPLQFLVNLNLLQNQIWLYSFFNLGDRRGWLINDTPRPLYTRERGSVATV